MPPIISLEPSQRPNSRAMGMAVRDLETRLVRHAAPTLAGMKPIYSPIAPQTSRKRKRARPSRRSPQGLPGFIFAWNPLQTALEAFYFWYSAPNSSRALWTMNTPANCLRRAGSKTFPLKASYLKSSAASKLLMHRAQHLTKRIAKPRPRPNPNNSFLAVPRVTTTTMVRITFASAEQKPRFREKNSKPRKANRHSRTR